MRVRTRVALIGTGLLLAAAVTPMALAAPVPAGWRVVASPNPGGSAVLFGVTSIGPKDFWSVGETIRPDGTPRPLITHQTGSGWKVVGAPTLDGVPGRLAAVSAVSAKNIWAVGVTSAGTPLAAFFNGGSWRRFPVLGTGTLAAVSARTPNDGWAVGSRNLPGGGSATLIEHWTGKAWQVVPSPNPDQFSALAGVVALSATDAWAVGKSGDEFVLPLVEHWDGHTWTIVPVPAPSPRPELIGLLGVTALSVNDIWAVGQGHLVEHWNGKVWQVVPAPAGSPDPDATTNFTAVAARGVKDVWAVGVVSGSPGPKTLTEHWNGTTWSVVPSPNPGPFGSFLAGVTAPKGGPAVAVGYRLGGPQSRSLILRNDDNRRA